jgi:DNA-binding GntR family transcriptional regulator
MMEEPVEIKTITEQIVDNLKRAIFSGRFLPGSKIKEKELSKWLGVSRTPIREALRVLELEGLVEIDPNKGTRIPVITNRDIDEICEFRLLLETYCIRKFVDLLNEDDIKEMEEINNRMEDAAIRKDYFSYYENSIRFHGYYVKKSQNKRLYIAFSITRNVIRGAQIFLHQNPEHFNAAINEHRELLEVLRRRDPEGCEEILRRHLLENCERMKRSIGDYFPVKERVTTL